MTLEEKKRKAKSLLLELTELLHSTTCHERDEILWQMAHGLHRTHQSMLACLVVFPIVYEWAQAHERGEEDLRNAEVLNMAAEMTLDVPNLDIIHRRSIFI